MYACTLTIWQSVLSPSEDKRRSPQFITYIFTSIAATTASKAIISTVTPRPIMITAVTTVILSVTTITTKTSVIASIMTIKPQWWTTWKMETLFGSKWITRMLVGQGHYDIRQRSPIVIVWRFSVNGWGQWRAYKGGQVRQKNRPGVNGEDKVRETTSKVGESASYSKQCWTRH